MGKRYRNSGEKFTRSYDNQEYLKAGAFNPSVERGGGDTDRHVGPGKGMEKALSRKGTICIQEIESKPI